MSLQIQDYFLQLTGIFRAVKINGVFICLLNDLLAAIRQQVVCKDSKEINSRQAEGQAGEEKDQK